MYDLVTIKTAINLPSFDNMQALLSHPSLLSIEPYDTIISIGEQINRHTNREIFTIVGDTIWSDGQEIVDPHHIVGEAALYVLNEIVVNLYEIRRVIGILGNSSDTIIILPATKWRELDSETDASDREMVLKNYRPENCGVVTDGLQRLYNESVLDGTAIRFEDFLSPLLQFEMHNGKIILTLPMDFDNSFLIIKILERYYNFEELPLIGSLFDFNEISQVELKYQYDSCVLYASFGSDYLLASHFAQQIFKEVFQVPSEKSLNCTLYGLPSSEYSRNATVGDHVEDRYGVGHEIARTLGKAPDETSQLDLAKSISPELRHSHQKQERRISIWMTLFYIVIFSTLVLMILLTFIEPVDSIK